MNFSPQSVGVHPNAARRPAYAKSRRCRSRRTRAGRPVEGLAERIRSGLREKLIVTTPRSTLVAAGACRGANISRNSSKNFERRRGACRSCRPRAFTISRWSAPTGRPRSISGRACSACPSSSSSPISTMPEESHLYFDPGDGRLITIFTNEDRKPIRRRTPTEPGGVHHIAFNVSRATYAGGRSGSTSAASLTAASATGGSSSRSISTTRSACYRARLLPVRAAARLHPHRRAARGPPHPRRPRRLRHHGSPPRRCDRAAGRGARPRACRPTARPKTPIAQQRAQNQPQQKGRNQYCYQTVTSSSRASTT